MNKHNEQKRVLAELADVLEKWFNDSKNADVDAKTKMQAVMIMAAFLETVDVFNEYDDFIMDDDTFRSMNYAIYKFVGDEDKALLYTKCKNTA